MSEKQESIALKFGTLKGWRNLSPSTIEILQEYADLGMSMSTMQQQDTPEQKRLLCKAIRNLNGTIYDDWSGEIISQDEAVEYVMEYNRD